MKLKRMAAVAAAAVVGPTVLMATPAMADEARNPAVTSPAVTPAAAEEEPTTPQTQKPAVIATGPKLTLKGVPSSFTSGGDWQQFALTVDNSGGAAHRDYGLGLDLLTSTTLFQRAYIDLEAYLPGPDGTWAWQQVTPFGSVDEYGVHLADVTIEKNEKFDLQLRLKFSKDTPACRFSLVTSGGSNVAGEKVTSENVEVESTIATASHTTGGGTGSQSGGNDTKPNGAAQPIGHQGGATAKPVTTPVTTPATAASAAGGRLAETGADAATRWALGAGGVALAMGAALVAGTGRRRRPTS